MDDYSIKAIGEICRQFLSTFLDDGSWLYQPTQKASMHQKFEIPNCFDFLAKIDFLIKM